MAAEIDCVAVTDHNTAEWVDRLQEAYNRMKQEAATGHPRTGFRELTIFPGVEISVNGGFHLLAIFDPSTKTNLIDNLLWELGYRGTPGDSDAVTRSSGAEAIRLIKNAGGIPIPAHADHPGPNGKALLAVRPDTKESVLDANSIRQIFEDDDILAVEWLDLKRPFPACVERQAARLARVLGSDGHSFQGHSAPGSRFTWVKMAEPTLEGLRLALLDGNHVSIRRSDEGAFDPFATPANFIKKIEIDQGRYIGNGQPARLILSPLYNGLIGGRGTGKSTIVHALRLAYNRDADLESLGTTADCTRVFKNFCKVVSGRTGEGALRHTSEIRVELVRNGRDFRLRWRADNRETLVEERSTTTEKNWVQSASQSISGDRFPIRIFSQGQIAAMAGEGRRGLLDIIDEAAGIQNLHYEMQGAIRAYLTKCAELRELEGQLEQIPEVERKLTDINSAIEAFERRQHTEVLQNYQRTLNQQREVNAVLASVSKIADSVDTFAQHIHTVEITHATFDPKADADILALLHDINSAIAKVRTTITAVAQELRSNRQSFERDHRRLNWIARSNDAINDYNMLQADLQVQGLSDPNAFARLVHERHQLEEQLRSLTEVKQAYNNLRDQLDEKLQIVIQTRLTISERREAFLADVLSDNRFVKIDVVRFGHDPNTIERNLRDLLQIQDDRFQDDILHFKNGAPVGGLAYEIATASDKLATLSDIKTKLTNADSDFGGRFRNYLTRNLQTPDFADRILCWFPDDDLIIRYSRQGDGTDWQEISQASQGQRSVALLAFLLSFGDAPIVLDQPEDDLDNQLIYDLIVKQIQENKLRRQLFVATHNPNVLVNGDAEMVHVFDFRRGQCQLVTSGSLQDSEVRERVCRVMEGGRDAFARRWARLGRDSFV